MPAKKKISSKPKSDPQSYVQSTLSTFVMIVAFVGLIVLGWFAYEEGKYPSDLSELPLIKKNPKPFKVKPIDPGGLKVSNQEKEIYDVTLNANDDVDVKKEKEFTKLLPPPEEPITIDEIESTKAAELPDDVKKIINENTESKVTRYRLTTKKVKKLSDFLENDKEALNIDGKKSKDSNEWANISKDIKNGISAEVDKDKKLTDIISSSSDLNENIKEKPYQRVITKTLVRKSKRTGRKIIILTAIPDKPSPNQANSKKASAKRFDRIKQNAKGVMHIDSIKGVRVQLGSFESISNLQQNWKTIKNKYNKYLKGLDYNIEKIDMGVQGIFYRLQAGSISNEAKAEKLCDVLSRRGQPCFVVRAK